MSEAGFTIHVDAKPLLDQVMETSLDAIKKYGQLMPRAATMAPDGAISVIMSDGEGSLEMIDNIFQGLQKLAKEGKCKATCVGYDIRLRQPNGAAIDAICIDIEHIEDRPLRMVVPYKRGWFGRTTFYEFVQHDPQPRVFNANG
ncbi:MAG: hypothetical protein JWM80_810 [Cyanobacteria bacterium RYN_339]|nr:hypothetical protein [Cyanobacteria bacterium RYN_339]